MFLPEGHVRTGDSQERIPRDDGGRNCYTKCQDCWNTPKVREKWGSILLQNHRDNMALPTPWFRCLGHPHNWDNIFFVLSHVVCDNLFWQPWETNTQAIIYIRYLYRAVTFHSSKGQHLHYILCVLRLCHSHSICCEWCPLELCRATALFM